MTTLSRWMRTCELGGWPPADTAGKGVAWIFKACPDIKRFTLKGASIQPDERGNELVRSIEAMPGLKTMAIQGTSFHPEIFKDLAHVMGSQHLESLSIVSCKMNFYYLVPTLGRLPLKCLDLSSNRLEGTHIVLLELPLSWLTQLEVLNISNNPIGDRGLNALSKNFKFWTNLRLLNVSNTGIGPANIAHFIPHLTQLSRLRNLDLSNNRGIADVTHGLVSAFEGLTNLTTLNISSCGLTPESAPYIKASISHLSALTELNISHNPIRTIGISNIISAAKYLQELNIELTHLASETFLLVTNALKTLEYLRVLNMGWNDCGPNAIRGLGTHEFQHLQELTLQEAALDDDIMVEFPNVLARMPNLRVLVLSANDFSDTGLKKLVDGLSSTPLLERLDIDYVQDLTTEGLEYLGQHIHQTPKLSCLDMANIDLGENAFPVTLIDGMNSLTTFDYLRVSLKNTPTSEDELRSRLNPGIKIELVQP